MTSRPSTAAPILAVLAIVLRMACLATVAFSDEPPAKALPQDVEQIMAWLPTDTESLIVARSFEMGQHLEGLLDAEVVDLKPMFFSVALMDLEVLNDQLKLPLPQKRVKLAVTGGRNAEGVSAFGEVRKESCSIVVLEKPLGDGAGKWKAALRAKAEKKRTIVDEEVFVFRSFTAMEPIFKPKEWQGTYVVLLAPDTILCATSDRYLEELLQRRKSPDKGRALPAELPEWKLIDTSSPAWMLWRPAADKEAGIQGGGWMWRDDVAEFVYLPQGDVAALEKAWHARWDDKPVFPRPKPGESLTQHRAGAVVLRVPTKEFDSLRAFPFAILIGGAFETEKLKP
jgi:hypothetical protein